MVYLIVLNIFVIHELLINILYYNYENYYFFILLTATVTLTVNTFLQ